MNSNTEQSSASSASNTSDASSSVQSQSIESVESVKSEPTIDEQISMTQNDKLKIVAELEESKSNLKDLESKLSAINQMYADLKK